MRVASLRVASLKMNINTQICIFVSIFYKDIVLERAKYIFLDHQKSTGIIRFGERVILYRLLDLIKSADKFTDDFQHNTTPPPPPARFVPELTFHCNGCRLKFYREVEVV